MSTAADPPRRPFRRFFLGLHAITAVALLPFALGVRWLVAVEPAASVVALASIALGTWLLRGRIALAIDDHEIGAARRSLEHVYFVHWCAAIGSLPMVSLTLLLAWLCGWPLGLGAGLAYALTLPLALWGVLWRPRRLIVRTVPIPIAGLPPAFEGFRIAQLSDLHVGGLLPPARARAAIRVANQLDVDLVALTGDYVTSGNRFHEVTAKLLGELRAREGVAAVLGNHDNFGGREPFVSTLVATGVRLLRNESFRIERGGATLVIAGIDDIFTRRSDVNRTFLELDARDVVVALAHDPRLAPEIAGKGAALILSGHTHWGQVGVPWRAQQLNVARSVFRAPGGLSHIGATQLYVHPGIGATGVPVRFGVAPEVTVLVLRSATGCP